MAEGSQGKGQWDAITGKVFRGKGRSYKRAWALAAGRGESKERQILDSRQEIKSKRDRRHRCGDNQGTPHHRGSCLGGNNTQGKQMSVDSQGMAWPRPARHES